MPLLNHVHIKYQGSVWSKLAEARPESLYATPKDLLVCIASLYMSLPSGEVGVSSPGLVDGCSSRKEKPDPDADADASCLDFRFNLAESTDDQSLLLRESFGELLKTGLTSFINQFNSVLNSMSTADTYKNTWIKQGRCRREV